MARYPEFKVPEGYQAPEGIKEGEEFQELCTLKLKADGKMMCVVEVGEHRVGGADREDYRKGVEERATSSMSES